MQIEELNNLKEPNQKIIFNEMAKKQIVNDFKNDIGIQNTVLNVNPSTAQLSKRIALMIDLKIWDIYKNSLSEKDLNINQQQGNSKSFMEVFPFYKTFLNVPMNHKNLYLIIDNVEQVFKYLEIEKNSNFIKGFDRPHISYKTERNFFKLIKSFSDEVANNIEEKKLSFINLPIRVKELNNLLNKCIELIEKYKDDFFKVEMHDPYFDKDCNWYKLIYKDLQIIKGILEGYLRELKIQNSIEVNSTVNIESNFENKDDNNHIEKFILEEFNNMHKDNWKYAFINESDFLKFVKILTCYFQNIQYELPNEPIKLKRGCKTVLSRVFNPIHKEFKTIKLKHDNEYLNIIRVLEHFNKLSDASIYKDITR